MMEGDWGVCEGGDSVQTEKGTGSEHKQSLKAQRESRDAKAADPWPVSASPTDLPGERRGNPGRSIPQQSSLAWV